MVDVQINNLDKENILETTDIKKLEIFVINICKELTIKNKIISIVIADSIIVTDLNKKYRNINDTTDVLSFPLSSIESEEPILGEIVIDLERAQSQAGKYKNSLLRELSFLILHGILHLIGYDHDKEHDGEMRKQEKRLESFLLTE